MALPVLLILLAPLGCGDEEWSVLVLEGNHHIGVKQITHWPAPEGECINHKFQVEALPDLTSTETESQHLWIEFVFLGETSKGLVRVNGHDLFKEVTVLDDFFDKLSQGLHDAVKNALGGCEGCESQWTGRMLSRYVETSIIKVGTNLVTACTTDGDFLLVDGIRLQRRARSTPQQ